MEPTQWVLYLLTLIRNGIGKYEFIQVSMEPTQWVLYLPTLIRNAFGKYEFI